jgi:hypothetical protein
MDCSLGPPNVSATSVLEALFIATVQGFPAGAIVGLRFALGSISINSKVIVRNVYPGQGIGVQFLDLSPEDRNRLQAFIQARQSGRRR